MLYLDASRALTCHGCGQVGSAPSPEDEAARRRSTGFYLFHDAHGAARVACCRCQQILPDAPSMRLGRVDGASVSRLDRGALESNERSVMAQSALYARTELDPPHKAGD